jgi:death on curing protein
MKDRPLRAQTDPERVYLSGEETLALFAEVVGVSVEAARQELRDEGLLESALARPIHAAHYANADLAEQAATLLWGIAENQPFVDGNKRIALVVMLTFLEVNGYILDMPEDERVKLMFEVAAGLEVRQVGDRLRPLIRPFVG